MEEALALAGVKVAAHALLHGLFFQLNATGARGASKGDGQVSLVLHTAPHK